ncbi:MAG: hypothetical protein QME74_07620 [Candidatus Edwardsbacteria bacterium]|nr:hypothetical protein [Candidatus Edwardsbacteria bacterium]
MRLRLFLIFGLLVLATGPQPGHADYRLILPLQYNAYQPVSARALGCGNNWATQAGLGSVFANPAALSGGPGISAELGSSSMSAFHSHGIIATGPSTVVPSTVIAGWGVRNNFLAFGARRAQSASLNFHNPLRPQAAERMKLGLNQLRGGWSIGITDLARLGIALGYDQATIDWSDQSRQIVKTSTNSQNYALGFAAEIWRGLSFGLFYASKTNFSSSITFDYFDTIRMKGLIGAKPSVSGLGVRYQIDTGFVAAVQLELTGWQSVSDGYVGTMDWHVGLVIDAARWLTFRAGGYSLATPLDPYELERRPGLHDLYFLTAGAGGCYWRIYADLGVATSYPFSGKGQNQNIVSFSLGYSQ